MKQLFRQLGLLVLLLAAQQGAVMHELGHFVGVQPLELRHSESADAVCGLCPAFAQVATPAFSHAFRLPWLARRSTGSTPDVLFELLSTAAPAPRSRGPPAGT